MDWWNELWLNEGFATWVGWLAVDHFYPGKFKFYPMCALPSRSNMRAEWNVWSQFVVRNSRGNKRSVKTNVDVITG
jgi:aminopeptidase N